MHSITSKVKILIATRTCVCVGGRALLVVRSDTHCFFFKESSLLMLPEQRIAQLHEGTWRTELTQVDEELFGHLTRSLASDIISSYKGER